MGDNSPGKFFVIITYATLKNETVQLFAIDYCLRLGVSTASGSFLGELWTVHLYNPPFDFPFDRAQGRLKGSCRDSSHFLGEAKNSKGELKVSGTNGGCVFLTIPAGIKGVRYNF